MRDTFYTIAHRGAHVHGYSDRNLNREIITTTLTGNREYASVSDAKRAISARIVAYRKKLVLHYLYRNGRLYDVMDSRNYATVQIAASLSGDMPGDKIELKLGNGETIYEGTTTITTPQQSKDKQ